MCRSIKTLHRADQAPNDEEVQQAALQFVRKISGYRKPSEANAGAFNAAVDDIVAASLQMLGRLQPRRAAPRATGMTRVSRAASAERGR
ncbi:MAG: DUF2277 domain-containing protein [SAR202 cluster bacterium]|nr:DUF2277 domain-containing protein [SAR202 cluster bacterium]